MSESEIASQLGVSRTPAREALAMLRAEGLVAIVPQLGTFVTPISQQAVADALFAREALECAAVRLAAQRCRPEDAEALYANLEEQELAVRADDVLVFDALDEDLHRQICDLSGHGIAWSLSRRVSGHLDRARELGLRKHERMEVLAKEHCEIVDAVAANDPGLAQVKLRAHLRRLLEILPELRSGHPDFFAEATAVES
jgi:DNA-binding GntR family transcriptional regulator